MTETIEEKAHRYLMSGIMRADNMDSFDDYLAKEVEKKEAELLLKNGFNKRHKLVEGK